MILTINYLLLRNAQGSINSMKHHLSACYLILFFSIVGLLACSDSDNKDASQPLIQTKTPSPNEAIEVQQREVDFAAEGKKIRELFDSHTAAVKANKVDNAMKHWLKLGNSEVFVAHEFLGAQTVAEK